MELNNSYYSAIAEIFNSYVAVSPATVATVVEVGSIEEFKKEATIFAEKKYNAYEYFLLEGICHRFNINNEDQPVTSGLYMNRSVITPHFSRTINSQSIFSLQALSNCTFLKVPIGAFDELRNTNHQLRAFGQRVVEKEFVRSLSFDVIFRSYSAKDRLLFFREYYPQLENLVPHTIIASFLGITPVSFSRIRNDLTKAR